jgi:protein-L-isoaspartate(D-aspartate) O-methyltransferase
MNSLPEIIHSPELDPPEARQYRHEMVTTQLMACGIRDHRVLEAMRNLPRHLFCPSNTPLDEAYGDFPLPVGHGQTISQPLMVADMLQCLELKGDETVLEIGTGSGYNAALLGLLARRVVSLEIISGLAESASHRLEQLELGGAVEVVVADGSLGWPAGAPYDGIVVTAGTPGIPATLKEQLRDGGRLVIPVGDRFFQELLVVRRRGNDFPMRPAGGCRFVPLTGQHGWK